MERAAFESELREQGYGEVVDRRMEPNLLNPEHAHEFDARLLVLEGAMTIAAEGSERTYRAGETFTMEAGCRHSERSGLDGGPLPRRPPLRKSLTAASVDTARG
jgi:mannose-6-phosphate isomerase-like protein (cupin superfamily)